MTGFHLKMQNAEDDIVIKAKNLQGSLNAEENEFGSTHRNKGNSLGVISVNVDDKITQGKETLNKM